MTIAKTKDKGKDLAMYKTKANDTKKTRQNNQKTKVKAVKVNRVMSRKYQL